MTQTGTGGYADALRVGEFRALSLASLVSILGDSVAYLAVTVLVFQRTGSALLAALTFAVAFVPYLFGGTLLSGLVDRIPARRLLIGSDLVAAVLVAVIAIPAMPVAVTFAGLVAIGTLAPVRSGTVGATVAEILPGAAFIPGRSVLRIIAQTSQIGGAAVGGLLLVPFGTHGALLADTASFVVSAGLVAAGVRARPLPARANPGQRLMADSLGGLRAVWSDPAVRRLLLLGWAIPFVSVAPEALAAPAVSRAGYSIALVGLWLAAIPVGTVIGDLLTVWAVRPSLRTRITWPLAFAVPALQVLFLIHPPLPAQLALLVLAGMASAYGLGLDQQLRDTTQPSLLARMFTVNSTGLMVSQGLGFVAAGALGEVLAAGTAISVAGVAGIAAALVLLLRSRLDTGVPYDQSPSATW